MIQDQASHPLLGALVNCEAKVLIRNEVMSSECGRRSTRFNGSIVAKLIHREGLSLRLFAQVAALFTEKEVRTTFKYLSFCNKLGMSSEEAEKFLRALS